MKRALLLSLLVPLQALAEEPTQTTTTPTTVSTGKGPTTEAKAKANPLANAVQARTPEAQAAQSGFQLVSQLDHYLGTGTFVNVLPNHYFASFLTVVPQYLFGVGKQRFVASATLRGSYEYTLPDSASGRHWSTGDSRLSLAAPALFRETAFTNISFSPSVALTVPTSLESWNAGLITAVSVGMTMSRSVGTVDFRAVVSGSRGFFTQATAGQRNPCRTPQPSDQTVDTSGSTGDNSGSSTQTPIGRVDPNCLSVDNDLLARGRPGQLWVETAGANSAWSLSAGGQIQWRTTGSLLLYVGYTYLRTWRYAMTETVDDTTPKALDSAGNSVAKIGLGNTDRTSTFVGASYQLNEHYSLDLGVSTGQKPFTDNGKVRFPFLSLGTWNENSTSYYFTLTAAY